jgi:acylphosphatase
MRQPGVHPFGQSRRSSILPKPPTTAAGSCAALTGLHLGIRICKTDFGSDVMVLHFLIQGRVQGVGFRWFVCREAGELELRGWVRNTEDGDVEVVASGHQEDLDELRASLRKGPRGSRVDRIVEHYLNESEAANLDAFRIEGAW